MFGSTEGVRPRPGLGYLFSSFERHAFGPSDHFAAVILYGFVECWQIVIVYMLGGMAHFIGADVDVGHALFVGEGADFVDERTDGFFRLGLFHIFDA